MSRSGKTPVRVIAPNPIYKSELVAKFVNFVMERGKKNAARKVVYGAFEIMKEKKKENPLKLFETAIDSIRPQVEVRSRRVGGANYQIPLPVAPNRQNALAFRWLKAAALARKGRNTAEKLAAELMDALAGAGGAIKKREDVHRMAEANKAFAHFARFKK
jgi:small subunit ribosomal protein S7